MPFARTTILLLGAAALCLLPALSPDLPGSYFPTDKAFAKNGNGNGNSNGNGNGNSGGNAGGGNGKSGGNGNSANSNRGGGNKGNGFFNRGNGNKQKTASGNGNGNGKGKGLGGFLNSVFGGNGKASPRQSVSRGSKNNGNSYRLPKSERASLKNVGVTPSENPIGKPKNLNAKMGRLNSLGRNYRALVRSKSPHLAGIQAYIANTLAYEDGLFALQPLQDDVVATRELFAAFLDDIVAHDEAFSYEEATAEELEARLEALNEIDGSTLSEEEALALEGEITTLSEALADDSFADYKASEVAYKEAEEDLGPLAESVSDDALEEALREMANDNRIREYGDDYIDDEILERSKEILGVGDYYGKIDEIREAADTPDDDGDTPLDDDETADTGDGDGSEGGDSTDEDLRLTDASN